jgi:hypothetical protein
MDDKIEDEKVNVIFRTVEKLRKDFINRMNFIS